MNKRPIVIMGVIFGLILIAAFLFVRSHNGNSTYDPSAPKEAENGAPPSIKNQPTINNTAQLANILLTEQFTAVQNALVAYMQTKYPSEKSCTITGNTTVQNDGSVTFALKLDASGKTLSVMLNRLQTGDITLLIPTDNYQQPLYIYDSAPTGD